MHGFETAGDIEIRTLCGIIFDISVINFLGVDNSEVIWEDVLFSGDVAGVSRGSVSRYVCVNKAGAAQVGPVSI